MKASHLEKKQVISTRNGEIIGKIVDFEFDPGLFQIEAVCIEKQHSWLAGLFSCFLKEPRIVMNVSRIQSIGSDVILVDCGTSEKKRDNHK